MKKINFLILLSLTFLLFTCRAENLSEDSHNYSDSENIHKVTSKKIFPSQFQKIVGLNDKFGTSESLLSQKMRVGKNTLEGAVIDSSFAMETTDGVIISYTFPVYRNNQKNVFENLVLQKKVGEQSFRSYLYKYYRTGANTYNTQNIEIYILDDVKIDTNGKIRLTTTSSAVGCYEIQTTTSDCGFKGHHTNGQYCPQSEGYMPLDYVTTFDNCPPSGGGGNTGGSGTNTGNPYTGGTTTFSYGLATPVPTYPKWGYCNPRTGSQWNALNLNTAQLSFINDAKQNAFRGEMVSFLTNNETYIFDCNYNPASNISANVKNVGVWIVDYSMTNPEFLNSESWSNFVASDIQFQQWAMNFLIQNPTTTWTQFESWFMGESEGQDGDIYDAGYWDDPNLTFPAQNLPTWIAFEAAFPKDTDPLYDTPEKMYSSLGGTIATFYSGPKTNTCAVRLSKALNYSGVNIPHIPNKTFIGADGKYYFKAAYEINLWMRKTFGTNPATSTTPYNSKHFQVSGSQAGQYGQNLPNLLNGKKGIYSIYSSDFKWATGHADLLYSNSNCANNCHFGDAPIYRLDVWILQ